jgi:GAF domain-containing protein
MELSRFERGNAESKPSLSKAPEGQSTLPDRVGLTSQSIPRTHLGPTEVDEIEGTTDDLVAEIAMVANAVLSGSTLEETLHQVVSTAVSAMEGCDSAGVFVVDGHEVRTVAHCGDAVIGLDRVQDELGEGPCLDAAASAAVVYVGDLLEDTRYPRFAGEAAATGIRTVLACPLSSDGLRGALNLYARLPDAFGATDRAKGTILAALAGAAIAAAAQRDEVQSQNTNLKNALVSRELIGQAQGILMERERVSADQAFDILRRASQHLNEKLRDVAQNLVDTGESPDTGEQA